MSPSIPTKYRLIAQKWAMEDKTRKRQGGEGEEQIMESQGR